MICGDGIVTSPEFCDDGNTEAGAGCSADCSTVESGFECQRPGSACTPIDNEIIEPEPEPEKTCGNGQLDTDEVCDDNNTEACDGCSADCGTIEEGFICPEPGSGCEPEILCGNGQLDADEVCDDNNTEAGDGCSADCKTIETGYRCDRVGHLCVLLSCGDGVVDEGELCDLGKMNMPYWPYTGGCSPECRPAHCCGDGLWDDVDRENGEVCDDGINDGAYGHCGLGCTYQAPNCGDAVVDAAYEQCDDGTNNGAYGTCNPDCTLGIRCGDGIVQPEFEQCDNGEQPSSQCSDHCMFYVN